MVMKTLQRNGAQAAQLIQAVVPLIAQEDWTHTITDLKVSIYRGCNWVCMLTCWHAYLLAYVFEFLHQLCPRVQTHTIMQISRSELNVACLLVGLYTSILASTLPRMHTIMDVAIRYVCLLSDLNSCINCRFLDEIMMVQRVLL